MSPVFKIKYLIVEYRIIRYLYGILISNPVSSKSNINLPKFSFGFSFSF